MERYVQGKPITLRLTPRDEDGVATTLGDDSGSGFDPGTVTIVDGAGAEVGEGAAALDGSALAFAVDTAAVDALDSYRATWSATGDVTDFEVVGGFLFELPTLRNYNEVLDNATAYPAARLRGARVHAEQLLEEACHVAFVPRGGRHACTGDGTRTLILPHLEVTDVYEVLVDGVPLTDAELAELTLERCGILRGHPRKVWPAGRRIEVHYVHGYARAPEPVSRAAVTLAGEGILPSSIPKRATVQTSGETSFRLTLAGVTGETGIPEVDAVINRYAREIEAVG